MYGIFPTRNAARRAYGLPELKDEAVSEFKVGQRVKVEIEGTVTFASMTDDVSVRPDDVRWTVNYLPGAYITVLDPANWPPRVGDIWAVGNDEYFARAHSMRAGSVVLTRSGTRGKTDYFDKPNNWDGFKDLNPVLVRRK